MPKPENVIPHQIKPGEVKNPKGRPKGSKNRSTIVKKWLETKERVHNPITNKYQRLSQADIMTLALISKARKGDVLAFKELMDSAYGKIAVKTELTGRDGKDFIPDFDEKTLADPVEAQRVYLQVILGNNIENDEQ